MRALSDAGLVLEGGGMRALFTVGVTDCLVDSGILIRDVYGVSAGACQGANYLSGQTGRGERIWTEYLGDRRYCGLYSLATTGDLFGAKMCYDLVPNVYDPFDYAAFSRRVGIFTVVVTNCLTGRAEYIPITDIRDRLYILQASSSLPLVANMVPVDGLFCLDGGIADSIPLERSISDGHRKNLVVLTRQQGYRKTPDDALGLCRIRYRRYPALVVAIETRHERYNTALELIAAEEKAGRAFVIRPAVKPDVGRVEKSRARLHALRETGYRAMAARMDELKEFLR